MGKSEKELSYLNADKGQVLSNKSLSKSSMYRGSLESGKSTSLFVISSVKPKVG